MLLVFAPWLAAMAVLMLGSGFFSSSEAAFFFLSQKQRRALAGGNRSQRLAARMLDDPERLLTAVLFWNLLINVTYFAVASVLGFRIEEAHGAQSAGVFALGSLLTLIFFSEMAPKSIAVLRPQFIVAWVAMPLSLALRLVDPLIPALRMANEASRRVLWPRFVAEPYLEVADLERAVGLSTTDAAILQYESTVLHNIVSLSTLRVEELMRPRVQFMSFRAPVNLSDLDGQLPPSGFVLITESDTDEVAAALPLRSLAELPPGNLEGHATPLIYFPWCMPVGHALEEMRSSGRQIAAIVNEFGETIGILTFDDILDTLFTEGASRSARLFDTQPLKPAGRGVWHVTGMTTLRRLSRQLDVVLPASSSVTVAGIIQEVLGRVPVPGDRCPWGPFSFRVLEVPERGVMLVELTRNSPREGTV